MTLERKIELIKTMHDCALREYVEAEADGNKRSADFNNGYRCALDNVLDILQDADFAKVLFDTYMKGE